MGSADARTLRSSFLTGHSAHKRGVPYKTRERLQGLGFYSLPRNADSGRSIPLPPLDGGGEGAYRCGPSNR
jgi:hypothetical protein